MQRGHVRVPFQPLHAHVDVARLHVPAGRTVTPPPVKPGRKQSRSVVQGFASLGHVHQPFETGGLPLSQATAPFAASAVFCWHFLAPVHGAPVEPTFVHASVGPEMHLPFPPHFPPEPQSRSELHSHEVHAR